MMDKTLFHTKGVMAASRLLDRCDDRTGRDWKLENLLGRFVELSGDASTAVLTIAAGLVREAQVMGEPAAWIATGDSTFFPPDFEAAGVGLESLPVIRVRDPKKRAWVADQLLRSGGFALVVLDLGRETGFRVADQTRLVGLAQKHHTALLCLTRKRRKTLSLGSLVSLHGETWKERIGFNRFDFGLSVVKDKRKGPGWERKETCDGPEGLY